MIHSALTLFLFSPSSPFPTPVPTQSVASISKLQIPVSKLQRIQTPSSHWPQFLPLLKASNKATFSMNPFSLFPFSEPCVTFVLCLWVVMYYSFVRISRSFLCISHVLLVSLQLDCILPEGKNHILISSLYFRGASTSGKNIGIFCCMILISCIVHFLLIWLPEHSPFGSWNTFLK